MTVVVIAGTDTGVGKTVVTAALAALARARGERVAVIKPVQTGVRPGEPGDLDEIARLSGVDDLHELARFEEPLAPATAARRAGATPPTVQELTARITRLKDRDLVLVEGAGGVLVQLDARGGTLADLAAALRAPALVVARAGLGTLNAAALTVEALRARSVECVGVVIGAWPEHPDLAAECNLDDLPAYAGFPLLGRLPDGAGRLSRDAFLKAARTGLAPGTQDERTRWLMSDQGRPSIAGAGPAAGAMADIRSTLEGLRADGLYRKLRIVGSAIGPRVVLDGAEALLLCSNDYLGLAGHPAVRAAAAQAAESWGAGAGASRLVSGNLAIHAELEQELAAFKGHDACVLFGSGYLANTGVISALASRDGVILSDALNHASIIDGCRQSHAETIVYHHCDLDALAASLERARGRRAVIVTDGLFSMDGDLAPLTGIVELAQRHGALVVVDEAHATGVIGPGGRGLVAALGLEREVDVVIGTLSKALGSYGAFVCCSSEMAEFLINRARALIFSTGLPPPSAAAALAALRLLRDDSTIVQRLWSNARTLRDELAAHGCAIERGEMPIIPLLVGDPHTAMAMCQEALREGVFVQAIRPPTVPGGTSRLRAVATAGHDEVDLSHAASVLAAAMGSQSLAANAQRGTRTASSWIASKP